MPWLGSVPAHWEIKPLNAAATLNDEVLPEATDPAHEITYVDIGSVSLTNGIERTETLPFGSAPSRARRVARDGDILVSTVRTYLKAIAPVVRPADNLIASTGFAVVRAKAGQNANFLKYALQCEPFVHQVIARSNGVSYPAVNASDLARIPLVMPREIEQCDIARFLDRETAKIDALIAEQEKLLALLAEKRQATISHAVTRGVDPDVLLKQVNVAWLGHVPAHWKVARLATLFREITEAGDDGLPILSVSIHDGVSDRELGEAEMDRKVSRSDDRSKYKRVAPNDLVYNMMRAWQGAFGAVEVPGQVSPAYVVARPRMPLRSQFVELLLRTPAAMREVRRVSRGITDFRLRLYWDEFKNLQVAIPPVDEQDAILSTISSLETQFDELSAAARHAIHLLHERRAALITAAVTGQIDVRHAAQVGAA
ncbi:MAG TPA: restriction endonuclease subunit S [Lysobacter sp.]